MTSTKTTIENTSSTDAFDTISNSPSDLNAQTTPTAAVNKNKLLPEKKIKWSPENEKILVEWCDIAQCYKWLNTRAHAKYSVMHAWFTIPAITLSTISGTASFAQTSIPAQYQLYAPMVIGTINICIGILTTVQQYLKISELKESHRVMGIAWDKYARNISIELAKLPEERMDAGPFLKMSRQEFDRLMETSPVIPSDITAEFMKTFTRDEWTYTDVCNKWCGYCCSCRSCNPPTNISEPAKLSNTANIEEDTHNDVAITINSMNDKNRRRKEQFEKLKKPDICNIIVSAEENRHPWYKEVEKARLKMIELSATAPSELENRVEIDFAKRQEEFREKEKEMRDREKELEKKIREIADREQLEKEKQAKKMIDEKQKAFEIEKNKLKEIQDAEFRNKYQLHKVDDYVTMYFNSKGRKPTVDEIREHFKTILDIDPNIVNKFIETYNVTFLA